ncbi:flagellar basal-body MS-ring/collar protein FliF [Luteibacter jiangsuensis]
MEQAKSFWQGWSMRKRIVLAGGTMAILALAGAIAWWSMRITFEPVFTDLKETDAAEITAALDTMQVPHRFADGGATLLVPADAVYDVRMKLVSQGVPHGGNVGFESFKDSDFGVTEFAQRVNYQRALQGELERTIGSIAEIASVRVHLTLRRAGMFETDESPSKASVAVSLHPGRTLDPRQVAGIQRLVASAVDGLMPERVAVLGPGGAPLSAGTGGAAEQGDEQARIETRLRQRVDGLLRDVLGDAARYSVSVDVRLNYDRVKQVSDRLLAQGKDGNGLVVRQKSSTTHAAPASEGEASRTGGDSELEFAHGREQEEVERAPGRIERISIGVVIPAGVPEATVARLQAVIGAAAGLDTQRGDRLDIAAVAAAPRGIAVSPVASTASTPRAAVAPGAVGTDHPFAWPAWAWIVLGVALAGGATGAGFGLGRRRRQPRRLAPAERERMLADVRQWLELPERL